VAVSSGLALHKDELNVIFDDGIWLVGSAKEFGTPIGLKSGIADLVPDNRVQVVKTNLPALHTDIGVKRDYPVASVPAARQADTAHYAYEATTRDENAEALPPHHVQPVQELLAVPDVAELARRPRIFF